jgi:AraC-like DNA-binding protein
VFTDVINLPFKPYPPRPEQCLIFIPRDRQTVEYVTEDRKVKRTRSVIVGQQLKRINLGIGQDFLTIIVVFNPGKLKHLTGINAQELTHNEIDAHGVFSNSIEHVNERLSSTDSYQEMIRIIDHFLLECLRKKKANVFAIDSIANVIFNQPEHISIDWLASQACLSPRQLERKFIDTIGVGPKLFMRISRFYKTYNMKFKNQSADWLSIALACGYHDYQHLVRDYKDFASVLPNALFQEDANAPERLFGLQEPGDHPGVT